MPAACAAGPPGLTCCARASDGAQQVSCPIRSQRERRLEPAKGVDGYAGVCWCTNDLEIRLGPAIHLRVGAQLGHGGWRRRGESQAPNCSCPWLSWRFLEQIPPAQTEWQMRCWSGRSDHALAYDGARGRTVLFGGYRGSSLSSETWEWNGTSWELRTPSVSPVPVRFGHAMAYDSARRKTVLLRWSQRHPSPLRHMGVGRDHLDAADSGDEPARPQGPRPRLRQFAEQDRAIRWRWSPAVLSDTWEWDGSAWISTDSCGEAASPLGTPWHSTTRGAGPCSSAGRTQATPPTPTRGSGTG